MFHKDLTFSITTEGRFREHFIKDNNKLIFPSEVLVLRDTVQLMEEMLASVLILGPLV